MHGGADYRRRRSTIGEEDTTNWYARGAIAKYGGTYSPSRVVTTDGNLITWSGVTASIDMGLKFCKLIAGDLMAQAVQVSMDYQPEPLYEVGDPSRASEEVRDTLPKRLRFQLPGIRLGSRRNKLGRSCSASGSAKASSDSIRISVVAKGCCENPTIAGGTTVTRMQTKKGSASKRVQSHAELLESALARPGIREIMKVYSGWQEKDQGLDVYRSATKKPERVTTTNSSRAC